MYGQITEVKQPALAREILIDQMRELLPESRNESRKLYRSKM